MHATLTIAATHDRLLHAPQLQHRTIREDFHWTKCLSLFNQKLNQPIQSYDRDPLWAAAAMLGVISFSSVDAMVPRNAWPLDAAKPTHLDWLNISKGKMAVWDIVNPLRPDSIFSVLREDYLHLFRPLPDLELTDIPDILVQLCGLDDSSTADSHPYLVAVQALLQVLNSPPADRSLAKTLAFVGHMKPRFKDLLGEKDPVALLLMCLWFSKVRGTVWWLDQRATVEGDAIFLYLQRFHKDNQLIQQVLKEARIGADYQVTGCCQRRFVLPQSIGQSSKCEERNLSKKGLQGKQV